MVGAEFKCQESKGFVDRCLKAEGRGRFGNHITKESESSKLFEAHMAYCVGPTFTMGQVHQGYTY